MVAGGLFTRRRSIGLEAFSMTITIRRVLPILTMPDGVNRLVVVKVETSEPGLHGVGCATFTQRPLAVHSAVADYLDPFLRGKPVDAIEDLWQTMMVNAYWRTGPVLNNAISGVDQALWDIMGKRAGLPVYQLLGGACRRGATVYRHADGSTADEVVDSVRRWQAEGVRHVRCQLRGYGSAASASHYDPAAYARSIPKLFEHLRGELGDEIGLLHDVHERLAPADAIVLAQRLDEYRLFFLEDPFPPEHSGWLPRLREHSTTPIAYGELFTHPQEWLPLVSQRLIDFIRVHVSAIGGLTPARKLAALCEAFGVRTAWHGPADTSPVGHAANLHLDLACHNFGIQEWCGFPPQVEAVFPGCPSAKDGYLYASAAPGLGIDIDEQAAAKFPCREGPDLWTLTRTPDGTPARP
jgi:mannonate dehydratase